MPERPNSRYTRDKTWSALYSQHINACYALVPYSATNNSISLIRCKSAAETETLMRVLLDQAGECERFYESRQTPDHAPDLIKSAREAVVLARASDYYHYHLSDRPGIALVVCGLHDSYLHLPCWETRSNRRYAARETAVKIGSPEFDAIRATAYGHNILIGALVAGDLEALAFLAKLPARTRRRLQAERTVLQSERYRGRPLAFHTEAERQAIGAKISAGLIRYHAGRQSG